jgi:glycosyltransferase involved in cell wall biosynthesis
MKSIYHLAIVSGTYNRLPLLKDMVASARAALPPGIRYQFVLVDGGSTDGTLEWCRAQSDVVLIEQGELLGAVKAFDAGAFAADAEYVILANDDITFAPNSILPGLVWLEEHPGCGAVAFEDNRLMPGAREWHVLQIPISNWSNRYANYAQVGMFRKWLGDLLGWWGLHGTFTGRTYGGDNALSAAIWDQGYTVDAVPGCRVHDYVHPDELRTINNGDAATVDSDAYYAIWPDGPTWPGRPQVHPPRPGRQIGVRILYLPIFEAGHAVQHAQKRGLRDALSEVGMVYEVEYVAFKGREQALEKELLQILHTFQPDLIVSQLHGPDIITPALRDRLRATCPRMVWVNWNGDYWPSGLTSPAMLDLLRGIDLQLVVNGSVLETYEQHAIPAAYWQIGYEDVTPLPNESPWDILFLGNGYSEKRQILYKELMKHVKFLEYDDGDKTGLYGTPITVGVYGSGWPNAEHDCTYDFERGAALYRRCKIAIGDNQFPDAEGFVSNRLFQALAAGAFLLHQRVPGLEALTGLRDGEHYVAWDTFEDLHRLIAYYLDPAHEAERVKIAAAGEAFTHERHSFRARVRELFRDLLPLAKKKPRRNAVLRFTGPNPREFGLIGGATGKQYLHEPGRDLVVDALDVPHLLSTYGEIFREVGTPVSDPVAQSVEAY